MKVIPENNKIIIYGKLTKRFVKETIKEIEPLERKKVEKYPGIIFILLLFSKKIILVIITFIVIVYFSISNIFAIIGILIVASTIIIILRWLLVYYFGYPKKMVEANLIPPVNYNLLILLLRRLVNLKKFNGSDIEVWIYTDYKEKKVINGILKKVKTFNFLGNKYILFPKDKKIVVELKVKKWAVYLRDKDIAIKLYNKVKLVSEEIETRSGKVREFAKTVNKFVIEINNSGECKRYKDVHFAKKKSTRVPVYSLEEPSYNYVLVDLDYYLKR